MADSKGFKQTFDQIAVGGFIGDPNGKPAYAYIRVSDSDQADEGRSGLPRQIQNVHEAASRDGYRVPWELVFADDATGFEFERRRELSRLRREYKSSHKRASAVVIEHLDRLSRNADWHQGYLLDEMQKFGLVTVFWKSFSSRIERAVLGAVAQDGMELTKARYREGVLHKARDGRITARTPAYGYKIVDDKGQESSRSRRMTYYAIRDDEAHVVRYIYEQIAIHGLPVRQVARTLEGRYPPPKQMKNWEPRLLSLMIRKPLYKGEFIAHRHMEVKVPKPTKDGLGTRMVTHKVERPESEWIRVPVPAIVSPELWELANNALDKNRQTSRRNSKRDYLLTGLVRCVVCGHNYCASQKTTRRKGKTYVMAAYKCSSMSTRMPVIREEIACTNSQVSDRILEPAVWAAVCSVLLKPHILIEALERQYFGEESDQLQSQIRYIEQELAGKELEDERLYRAYQAGAFDEHEFSARRRLLKEREGMLTEELSRLKGKTMTREQFEAHTKVLLALSERAIKTGIVQDAPFAIKRQIVRTVVDTIVLDATNRTFIMQGVLSGAFQFGNKGEITPIVSSPASAAITETRCVPAPARPA